MRPFAVVCAVMLSAFGSASAQPQTSYESVTRPHVEGFDALLVRDCPQQDRSVRWVSLEEMTYPLRGDRETRDAGTRIFTEHYEATGCGAAPRRLNVQVFHGAQAPRPSPMLLPPGETAVSAGVMVDLFRTHIPQLMALRHPTCRTAPAGEPIFLVTDTILLDGEPFAQNEQVWTERWRYRACGEAHSIDISFVSNGERVRMVMNMSAAPSPVAP